MEMSDAEIFRSWKQALYPWAQRQVLAELNLCHVNEIDEIIIRMGGDPQFGRRRYLRLTNCGEVDKLHNQGFNAKEIARITGYSYDAIYHYFWRRRNESRSD